MLTYKEEKFKEKGVSMNFHFPMISSPGEFLSLVILFIVLLTIGGTIGIIKKGEKKIEKKGKLYERGRRIKL